MKPALLAVIAALVLAPSAHAGVGVFASAPVTVSATDGNATGPQIVVTPSGTAILAWRDGPGTGSIFVSVRPPGGEFSAPVKVSGDPIATTAPMLGVDSDGAVTLAWMEQHPAQPFQRVMTSRRPVGGSFGAPVNVSKDAGAFDARLAVTPDGTVSLIWTAPFAIDVMVSTRSPDGTFGTPVAIPQNVMNPKVARPQAAAGPDGTLVVAWLDGTGDDQTLKASVRSPGGAFTQAVDVSSGGNPVVEHEVAFAADGAALLTWFGTEGGTAGVQTSIRAAGGSFAAPVRLVASAAPALGVFPALGGAVSVLWRDGQQTRESVRAAGGGFAASVAASEHDGAARPVRLYGADGSTSVAQVRTGASGQPLVEFLTRPGGGAFGAALPLSGALDVVSALDAALLPDGDVVVAWATPVAGHSVIQARWSSPPAPPVVIPPPPKPGTSVPEPDPPTAVRRALITGTAKVGRKLTCTRRAFTGATKTTVRWLRTSYPIPGAVKTTYKLTKRDRGKRISCEVRASGPGGSARMVSKAVLVRR